MEQIEIRQPKMPVAQSFIQILGTYLALFFKSLATNFPLKKKDPVFRKRANTLISLDIILKLNFIALGNKFLNVMNLRI